MDIVIHGRKTDSGKVSTLCGIDLLIQGLECQYFKKHYKTIITTFLKDKINCKNCLKTNNYNKMKNNFGIIHSKSKITKLRTIKCLECGNIAEEYNTKNNVTYFCCLTCGLKQEIKTEVK